MWDMISKALESGGVGGIAQTQRGQVAPGETDWNMWSSILGRGAQAFTAGDPTSWQHQLGGLGAQLGQAGKMAMTQEAERKRKEAFRSSLLKALGLDVSMPGSAPPKVGFANQPKEEDPFGLGKLTMDRSLLTNPLFKALGGM